MPEHLCVVGERHQASPVPRALMCDGVRRGDRLLEDVHRTAPLFCSAARERERTLSVTTLADGFTGHFHAPELGPEFFPGETFGHFIGKNFAGGWFALDRIMLVRLLVAAVLAILFVIAFRKPQLVPKGLQNVAELGVDFVRINIAEETLGKKDGKRFLPLIATIFFTVLFMNAATIIPGLNISPNARIGMPIVLAIAAYIAMIYAGVQRYGAMYFKHTLVVPNLPWPIHILVVPIEFFSTFILRPITLALRLSMNFLAGHIILVLLYSATNFFFWQLNAWTLMSGVTLISALLFSLYELIVILLQAYIFALLTAVYIELSLHADSH